MTSALLVAAAVCCAGGLAGLAELRRRLELVARAEHELRGPAAGLALACEALRRDPTARRHALVIQTQLDRMGAALGDLAAARGGRRQGAGRANVELGSAVEASLRPWRAWLGGTSFEWVGGAATGILDRGRLAQALGNLVANAAEHGAGDLQVRGCVTVQGVRIEVRNRVVAAAGRSARRGSGPRALRPLRDRGRGLVIASSAARDLGGRLLFSVDGEYAVAVLDLPAAAIEPTDGSSGADTA